MFSAADSPAFTGDESFLTDDSKKGFDSLSSDYYDMDSEINYSDILATNMEDQAVPDFYMLNTPVSSSAGFPEMNTTHCMPPMSTTSLPPPPSYYPPTTTSYPMAPSHIPVQTNIPEQQDYSRGAVIMESTAPEPKPRRKGGRKPKNDPLPPHLEERRRLRRIRNKEAAQKCRERRLAHTDTLTSEIEGLEQQTRYYEDLINKMREYKEQCEFILNSHRNTCRKNSKRTLVQSLHFNQFSNDSCSLAHRRSSSSEGDMHSPTLIL